MTDKKEPAETVTYYVVVPFLDSEFGPVPGEAREAPTAEAAQQWAASIVSDEVIGAVAFYRTGDPATGFFEEAVVLATVGQVDVDALESGQ